MPPVQFPCKQCGANLEYDPSASALKCPYCGFENPVPQGEAPVEELPFNDWVARLADNPDGDTQEVLTVRCKACGAEPTFQPNIVADICPFCGTALVATAVSRHLIKPRSLLPFRVDKGKADGLYRQWLLSRWFAPSDLKRLAQQTDRGMSGVYLPYWTYDCRTVTHYAGERGDDYWETEHYTTVENGRTVHKTRQVRRTRWRRVSGTVRNSFDDVLVAASASLPADRVAALEPWDLRNLVPYEDSYLAGFRAETYHVDLPTGFTQAREIMAGVIHTTICRDIGGDHQRVHSADTRYFNVTFKHVLLPAWVTAYHYSKRLYRVLINARTGEVQGQRPWSFWKITGLVLAILAGIGLIALIVAATQGH